MVEGHITRLFIQMEYRNAGDLHSFLQTRKGAKLEDEKILDLFIQLCRAVKVRLKLYYIYRDIKPQNLFMVRNGRQLKLDDFGIAIELENTGAMAQTQIGTVQYQERNLNFLNYFSLKKT